MNEQEKLKKILTDENAKLQERVSLTSLSLYLPYVAADRLHGVALGSLLEYGQIYHRTRYIDLDIRHYSVIQS